MLQQVTKRVSRGVSALCCAWLMPQRGSCAHVGVRGDARERPGLHVLLRGGRRMCCRLLRAPRLRSTAAARTLAARAPPHIVRATAAAAAAAGFRQQASNCLPAHRGGGARGARHIGARRRRLLLLLHKQLGLLLRLRLPGHQRHVRPGCEGA